MSVAGRCASPIVTAAAALLAALAPNAAAAQDVLKLQQRPELRDVPALTRAYNGSGQALFKEFAARPGNIVFSPYSIGTAMAMALAGARGETEREMIAVLQHSLASGLVDDANARAIAVLNGYDRGDKPTCPATMQLAGERCEGKPTAKNLCPFTASLNGDICVASPRFPASAKLLVANALMIAGGHVAKDYSALLKDSYAAEVFQGASLDTVNGWVSKRTEGKIERILEKMSDVVLVNAVYFKSRWALAFDKKLTGPEFFSLTRSRQELVPTMVQRTNHVVVSREGYRAIRLPYAVRSLAMVIALPNEVDGLGDVARRLDHDELAQMLAALRKELPRPVVLTLPRFKTEYEANLKGRVPEAWHDASVRRRPFRLLRSNRPAAQVGADLYRPDRPQSGDRGVRGIDRSRRRNRHRRPRHQRGAEAGGAAAVPGRPSVPLLPGRRHDRRGAVPGPHRRSAVAALPCNTGAGLLNFLVLDRVESDRYGLCVCTCDRTLHLVGHDK